MPHKDKAKHNAYIREWSARRYDNMSPEDAEAKKAKHRAYHAKWARDNRAKKPEVSKAAAEKYLSKRETIAGRPRPENCELCGELATIRTEHSKHGKPYKVSMMAFDHCHQSGKFRGWLCGRCNRVLGLVKEEPMLLNALAAYIEDHCEQRINNPHVDA